MRELIPLFLLVGFGAAALWRPWLGVLGLAVLGYLRPTGYVEGFMHGFPAYAVMFAATVAGTALHVAGGRLRPRLPPPDWRVLLLLALWLWFAITSSQALLPWAAWARFEEFSKVMAVVFLTLALIDTREKLFWLLTTMALSFALVAVKGGYWALITGFSDRVYGPPGSHFYDNNHFAVAAVMTIPLLLLWWHEVEDRWVRIVVAAAIAFTCAATLSSWSRGALLALGAMATILVWHSRRRWLATVLVVLMAGVLVSQLPGAWLERMETIVQFQDEGSAQGRLATWRVGLLYGLERPFFGVGFDGWIFATRFAGGGGRDWHSAYVEVLAEHGFPGLVLWLTLVLGSIVALGRAARGWSPEARYAGMLQAALAGYAVGAAFLGITYWDLLYQLLAAAIVLKRLETLAPGAPLRPGTGTPTDGISLLRSARGRRRE